LLPQAYRFGVVAKRDCWTFIQDKWVEMPNSADLHSPNNETANLRDFFRRLRNLPWASIVIVGLGSLATILWVGLLARLLWMLM
jgi:hypothetical protein